ncbi:hypothetical protein P3G55_02945 [Leptospira sp. 96542]|nr:hypothetical protein [Leptospira sp. 96542]
MKIDEKSINSKHSNQLSLITKTKKIKLWIFTLIFVFMNNCTLFKESPFDPNGELATILNLIRMGNLFRNFTTQSNYVFLFHIKDSNGAPLNGKYVKYTVYNEADENGEVGTEFNTLIDVNGRSFLGFSERGIAKVKVFNNLSDTESIGEFQFRLYPDLTNSNFNFLSISGNVSPSLDDLSAYANGLGTNYTLEYLGSANNRQFLQITVQKSFGSSENTSDIYIISSTDGLNYNTVTKIDGIDVNYSTSSNNKSEVKISKVTFNGFEYIFFLGEIKSVIAPISVQAHKNLVVRLPSNFIPRAVTAEPLILPSDYEINSLRPSSPEAPQNLPTLSFGNRFLISPYKAADTIYVPMLIDLTGSTPIVFSGVGSCAFNNSYSYNYYKIFQYEGIDYLHCRESGLISQNYTMNSIRSYDYHNNEITFNTGGDNYQSPPFVTPKMKLIGIVGNVSPYNGYRFPVSGQYLNTNPTISMDTNPITGLTTSITAQGTIRDTKISDGNEFVILSDNYSLQPAVSVDIFKSSDDFNTATKLSPVPTTYGMSGLNFEQFQTSNGTINLTWFSSQANGVGSFPVYLQRTSGSDDSWNEIPRIIKITQQN